VITTYNTLKSVQVEVDKTSDSFFPSPDLVPGDLNDITILKSGSQIVGEATIWNVSFTLKTRIPPSGFV